MRRGIVAAAALGLLVTPAAGPSLAQGGSPDPARVRASAVAALERGDAVSAEVALRAAIRAGIDPDALRAALGEALLMEGNRREARQWLTQGRFDPGTEAAGWRSRGRMELAEGRLAAAGQAFDNALRFAPDDPLLWVDIARLRFAGGEQAQAIEASERAVRLGPRNVRALEMRGLMVREQYGLAASLAWFEAGLAVSPGDGALLGEYAATLGDMGQYRAMLIVCRKLAEVDPGNARALYLQSVLAARAGRADVARSVLQRAGNRLRDLPGAMLLAGVLEYRAGNANLAVGHFDRLSRLRGDNPRIAAMLARALARSGNHRQVVARFDSAVRRPETSPYLMQVVAGAWRALGRRDRAAELAGHAAARGDAPWAPLPVDAPAAVLAVHYREGPNFAASAVPYVRGQIASGNAAEALAAAERLRDANPGASEAHLLTGDARMIAGDPAGALVDYGRAASIRFNEPVLRRFDAALRQAGRAGEADAMLVRYLAQNPESPAAMALLAASDAAHGRPHAHGLPAAMTARGLALPGSVRADSRL